MGARHNNERLLSMIEDAESLILIGQAQISNANKALVRTRWIDGDTVTPAASANGSESLPYLTPTAFMTGIGVIQSVADASQGFVGMVSPATVAAYTGNVAIQPFRTITLRGTSFAGGQGETITGNLTWTNTAVALAALGGNIANVPAVAVLNLHNITVTGNLTVADDATAVISEVLISQDEAVATTIGGNVDLSGSTHCAVLELLNVGIGGNIVSTAAATGAAVAAVGSSVTGTIVANNVQGKASSFGGNITTFAGTTSSFSNCNFTFAISITGGAGSVLSFDGPSWNAFLEAGGTIVSGNVLVVGGSQAGIVRNATSLGNADVNISLNGTGASAGLTGGGNFYVESTALTGGHIVTVKTGGGEKTGDTIDILKTDTAAQTYTVKNNAATTLMIIPVSVKGWARVQFNTVIPNDWGLIGGGAGFT